MKKTIAVSLIGGLALASLFFLPHHAGDPAPRPVGAVSASSPHAGYALKAARWDYLFHQLRDPATNSIPRNVRASEVEHVRRIAEAGRKTGHLASLLTWFGIGPADVGGRTRALAIDLSNPRRMLAGGVSGGLWESLDAGATWTSLEVDAATMSVTDLVQDPRPGFRSRWYYASGEFAGNSASDPDRQAPYFGSGLYRSLDNGRTWQQAPGATDRDITRFDSPFDFVNRVAVSPITGTLFVSSNATGIYRSADGGVSFGQNEPNSTVPAPVLGGVNQHSWSDVAVNADGTVLATLSSTGFDASNNDPPGVYVSRNDGVSWTNITPATFPRTHGRSVIAFAPSNPDIAYIFTTTLAEPNDREDVRLHRLNVRTGASEDRSDNLPTFGEAGNIDTQSNYNMALAVKPDDENFLVLGGTNLYRSANAFATRALDRTDTWIGGYDAADNDFGIYDNHHPDQHVLVFDPTNPNRLYTGNDGGVYMTNDVTRAGAVLWEDRNRGYTVSQFYTVALPRSSQDPRVAGGTQDNGTPYLRLDDLDDDSRNISVGDGGQLYLGADFAFVGIQQGDILKLNYNSTDDPTFAGYSFMQPRSANNQLFVSPFVVNPNNEEVMFYAAGSLLWMHRDLGGIRGGQTSQDGITEGWETLSDLPSPAPRVVTAMAISESPSHVLYYGASDTREETTLPPRIFRVDNADTDPASATDITPTGLPAGAYLVDIAINPLDADEILLVFSNYNVVGLYHSQNAGATYAAVEGNLTGTIAQPGPSLRSAAILNVEGVPYYFLGTSAGLFVAQSLNGNATQWNPEAGDAIGNAVVSDLAVRQVDGVLAAATHGRGLFLASVDETFDPRPQPEVFQLSQNYPNPFASTTRIVYDLVTESRVSLALYDLSGRRLAVLVDQSTQNEGRHEVAFDAGRLASGTYLYQIVVTPLSGAGSGATQAQTRKMMIIK
ncbi:MAG: T9SS type A sorting domain-containing protein [Rhodothermales bacterium]